LSKPYDSPDDTASRGAEIPPSEEPTMADPLKLSKPYDSPDDAASIAGR
jgi:hypothetical protein